ncbi:MAG: 50S ribosomal protein L4 [Rhodococcus sp.]|nr:50S ribosomal protein L4 [Rhodococcus sp. (in: high G+C Gram-positive bacteria)]
MKVALIGAENDAAVELPDELFDVQTNVSLIHQVVVAQLAAARQGTHSTKTRGKVRGGGAKPYRQKGTGRARQGSIRAPQYAGGGVVHGPQPRDYSQRTPKKMKAAALRGALSDRARAGRIHVVADFGLTDAPSTRTVDEFLAEVTQRPNLLLVVGRGEETLIKSARNLARVHLLYADQLNTYDVMCADDVIFTADAFAAFVAGPAMGKSVKASATEAEAVAAGVTEAIEDVADAAADAEDVADDDVATADADDDVATADADDVADAADDAENSEETADDAADDDADAEEEK